LKKQKARTVENYTGICTKHLIPAIGSVKLKSLSPERIELLINDLQKKLSSATVNLIYTVLKSSLKKAVTKKKLRSNPCDRVDTDELPEVERKEPEPLNEEAVSLFWNAIQDHRYKNYYILALYTGARQGEVLGFTWDCVDFENGTINIDKQLQRTGILETTKRKKKNLHTLSETDLNALKEQ